MIKLSPNGKLIALFSHSVSTKTKNEWKIWVVSTDFQNIWLEFTNTDSEFIPDSIDWYFCFSFLGVDLN